MFYFRLWALSLDLPLWFCSSLDPTHRKPAGLRNFQDLAMESELKLKRIKLFCEVFERFWISYNEIFMCMYFVLKVQKNQLVEKFWYEVRIYEFLSQGLIMKAEKEHFSIWNLKSKIQTIIIEIMAIYKTFRIVKS